MTVGQPQAEPQDRLSKCLRGVSFRDSHAGGRKRPSDDPHNLRSAEGDAPLERLRPSCHEREILGLGNSVPAARRFAPANVAFAKPTRFRRQACANERSLHAPWVTSLTSTLPRVAWL